MRLNTGGAKSELGTENKPLYEHTSRVEKERIYVTWRAANGPTALVAA